MPALEYRKLDWVEDWSGEAFSITSAKHDTAAAAAPTVAAAAAHGQALLFFSHGVLAPSSL